LKHCSALSGEELGTELEVLYVFRVGDCDLVESCLFIKVMILSTLALVISSPLLSSAISSESLSTLLWGRIGLTSNSFNGPKSLSRSSSSKRTFLTYGFLAPKINL
jgi:hypothetical protein